MNPIRFGGIQVERERIPVKQIIRHGADNPGRFGGRSRRAQALAKLGKGRVPMLYPLSLGNVVDHGQRRLAASEGNRAPLDLDIHERPVLTAVLPHAGKSDSAGRTVHRKLVQILDHCRHFLRRPDVRECHRQKLLPRIAVMLFRGFIDFEERECFMVEHQHRGGVAVENQAVPPFTLAQSRFRLLALSDVARVKHHPGNVRVAQAALADHLQITPGAVPVPETEFQRDRAVGIPQAVVETLQHAREVFGMDE